MSIALQNDNLGMIDSCYQLITGTQPSTWDFLLSSNLIGYFSYQVIWLVITFQNDIYLGMIDSSYQLITDHQLTAAQ